MADLAGTITAYRAILGSRVRAQVGYRSSFASDLLGTGLVGLAELAEVYVIFHNVPLLGGLTFTQALLVFALSNTCYCLADTVVGHLDRLPTYIRAGMVDAFYVRPLSLLGQLVTSELSLRRFGRLGVSLVVLVIALSQNDIQWTPATLALLPVSVVAGTAIMAGLFVCASAMQFFLVEGPEFTNAFTYGGSYAAQLPGQIYPQPLRILFTFVVPATFVAYLPSLVILGLPGGPGLPAWLGWFTPVAAVATWVAAMLLWRTGTRHYQGGGG